MKIPPPSLAPALHALVSLYSASPEVGYISPCMLPQIRQAIRECRPYALPRILSSLRHLELRALQNRPSPECESDSGIENWGA